MSVVGLEGGDDRFGVVDGFVYFGSDRTCCSTFVCVWDGGIEGVYYGPLNIGLQIEDLFLASYITTWFLDSSLVQASFTGQCTPGYLHLFHTFVALSAYTVSASIVPKYPKSGDCCEGMMVHLSTRLITSTRMFVAVGQGDRCGSVPSTVSAS